jgi:hypothetical protein
LPVLCILSRSLSLKMSDFGPNNPRIGAFKSCISNLTRVNLALMDRKVSEGQPLWPNKDSLMDNSEPGRRNSVQFSNGIGRFNSFVEKTSFDGAYFCFPGRVSAEFSVSVIARSEPYFAKGLSDARCCNRSRRLTRPENVPKRDIAGLAPNFAALPT